ncbi:OadG family protein [Enterococcus asini]|nr:OadG family protein [Enterococcus asini]MDT2756666.1 OadG family protein [Enterococcus asini]
MSMGEAAMVTVVAMGIVFVVLICLALALEVIHKLVGKRGSHDG